jgi:hypothetical protein
MLYFKWELRNTDAFEYHVVVPGALKVGHFFEKKLISRTFWGEENLLISDSHFIFQALTDS